MESALCLPLLITPSASGNSETGDIILDPLEGHTRSVRSVVFSPDGRRIVSASGDETIRIWNSETGEMMLGPLKGHTDTVVSAVFSPDGRLIVSASFDKTIRIWDSRSGDTVLGPLEGHQIWCALLFSLQMGAYLVML